MKPNIKVEVDNDDDPVEIMLKKTGCYELHYKVQVRTYALLQYALSLFMLVFLPQECIANTQDWRKCQNEVKEFKECMDRNRTKKT